MKKLYIQKGGAWASLLTLIVFSQITFAEAKNQKFVKDDYNDSNQSIPWYLGVGFSSVNVTCKDKCEDITFGVMAKVGYDFNPYFGIEARAIKTFWEYEQSDLEHYGLYLKPMIPINENLHFYGLLGYGTNKVGDIKSYEGSGFALGVGVNYFFDDNNMTEDIYELQEEYNLTIEHSEAEQRVYLDNLQELEDEKSDGQFGLFIDYQRLIIKSNAPDIDAINLGIVYKFN